MSALTNIRRFWRIKIRSKTAAFAELRAELTNVKAQEAQRSIAFEVRDSVSRSRSIPRIIDGSLSSHACRRHGQEFATASYLTFLESPFPVDVFAHYENPGDYLGAISDRRLDGSKSAFSISRLCPLALRKFQYCGQLFVLGNSFHNLPIYDQLCRTTCFPPLVQPSFITRPMFA